MRICPSSHLMEGDDEVNGEACTVHYVQLRNIYSLSPCKTLIY